MRRISKALGLDADLQKQASSLITRLYKAFTEKDMALVTDYLTQNFGKDSKINVNTAPLVELKTILRITAQEAMAVVKYRETNGKFKEWQDLQKVPGVDPKKIEDKKDVIAF